MNKIYETNFEFCNDDQAACYCSTDPMWIRRILKLAKKYPDDVRVAEYREGESICVNLPKNWFKVSPPKKIKRVMTDEQRAAASERMKRIVEAQREARRIEKEQKQRLAEMIYDE